jgi:hypothetical protein
MDEVCLVIMYFMPVGTKKMSQHVALANTERPFSLYLGHCTCYIHYTYSLYVDNIIGSRVLVLALLQTVSLGQKAIGV